MAAKFKIFEEEVESHEVWLKDLEFEGILVVQLYSSNYGPLEHIYPGADAIMKTHKKKGIKIKWRRLNISQMEENNRLHRIENSYEGGKNLCESDYIKNLESYSQYNHPQPFILFYKGGVLMDILRTANVPKIGRIIEKLLSEEILEPNPEMNEKQIVIGYDAVWDPEKERLEMEEKRCQALTIKIRPIFEKFFWFYQPSDKFCHLESAIEFASYITIGAEEQEQVENNEKIVSMFTPGETLNVIMEKIITQQECTLDPEKDLKKLEEFIESYDNIELRNIRLQLIMEMLQINLRTEDKNCQILETQVKLLQDRCRHCNGDKIDLVFLTDKTLLEAQQSLLSIFDEQSIFNMIRHGLSMLFQAERIKKIIENMFLVSEQNEEMNEQNVLSDTLGQEKVTQILTAICPDDFEISETITSLYEFSGRRFSKEIENFNIVDVAKLNAIDVEIDEISFKNYVNMDSLYYQFGKQCGEENKNLIENLKNGILLITDGHQDILEFQIHIAGFSSNVNHISIHSYSDLLNHYLATHKSKFMTLELHIMTPELIESLILQDKVSNLKVHVVDESIMEFLAQCQYQSVKKISCISESSEVEEAIQVELVKYIQELTLIEFVSNLAFSNENAKNLFKKCTEVQKIDLQNNCLILQFLQYPEIIVKNDLCFSSTETLFDPESWELMMKFLTTSEILPKHISFNGKCDVGDDLWQQLFDLIEQKSGCEALSFVKTGLMNFLPIANVINNRPHISDLTLVDDCIKLDEIEQMLTAFNEEREFELSCDFGELVKKKSFYEMALAIHNKHEWLMIENIIFSTQDVTPVTEEESKPSMDKKMEVVANEEITEITNKIAEKEEIATLET